MRPNGDLIAKTFRLLDHARIPELIEPSGSPDEENSNYYWGKVRDCYDVSGGRRIMITTDRLSAFDRPICSVPFKGQVLNEIARYWFERTAHAVPNHVLFYPDPNVVVVKKLKIIPIEIIVRNYLAGTTSTSILKLYQDGTHKMYGVELPDGLRPYEKLPETIITPTTKSDDRDVPLSPNQIIERDLLTQSQWEQVKSYALRLFAIGRQIAGRRKLILADTKYEFGLDEDGNIVLADEIHTPDSSRYWEAHTYNLHFEKGEQPRSWDKDIIRNWLIGQCNPYTDDLPEIPADLIARTMGRYIDAFEMITGKPFEPADTEPMPLDRIRRNLAFLGWL